MLFVTSIMLINNSTNYWMPRCTMWTYKQILLELHVLVIGFIVKVCLLQNLYLVMIWGGPPHPSTNLALLIIIDWYSHLVLLDLIICPRWCKLSGRWIKSLYRVSQRFRWFSWNSSLTVKPQSNRNLRPEMNVSEQVESDHKPWLAERPRNREANAEFVTFPISSHKSERMNR